MMQKHTNINRRSITRITNIVMALSFDCFALPQQALGSPFHNRAFFGLPP